MSKITKQPDDARVALEAAKAKLADVQKNELASISTPAAFEVWRRERSAATSEVERLSTLVSTLETAASDEVAKAQQVALQKLVDTQRLANEKLARRVREEGGPAVDTLLKLTHDIAAAAIVDADLNAKISDDSQKLPSADMLARYRPPAPRETISETETVLWVFAANGNLVGAQDEVTELADGSGFLIGSRDYRTRCVKRRFRSIDYREAEPRQHFVSFYEALQLPCIDGPAWTARAGASPAAVLQALNRRAEGTERQVLTELIALDAWTGAAA